jgi:aspartate racemase
LKVLHIADAAGEAIKKHGFSKVALLGTKFTMEGDFYRKVLMDNHGIETLIPEPEDREIVHHVIYEELIKGILSDKSRKAFINIIYKLSEKGAQGVILGCTEIPLLITDEFSPVPVFDTTRLHSEAIVKFAID